MHNESEILKNEIKYMCKETIQPPETNYTMFLLGAEFARGRVCQGASLSVAEMSRNRYRSLWVLPGGFCADTTLDHIKTCRESSVVRYEPLSLA